MRRLGLATHGWLGLILVGVTWSLNWSLSGMRTHLLFFSMWLGYCLVVDALVLKRRGTSLLTRSWRKFIGLFILSAPVWWLFELFNFRLDNWHYLGAEKLKPFGFWFWATVNFSTVIPAVFESAELIASLGWLKDFLRGPLLRRDRRTTLIFFILGWVLLALMLIWPQWFFPFVWLSVYFILEPVNVWLGNPNLARWSEQGNWRPMIAMWLGVWLTAFFWEMWNYHSYPKWVYHLPWGISGTSSRCPSSGISVICLLRWSCTPCITYWRVSGGIRWGDI